MPRTYDPVFRRRVVELVRTGRPVRVVATELGLAEATVYRWKAQDLIDRGVKARNLNRRAESRLRQRTDQGVGDRTGLGHQAAALFAGPQPYPSPLGELLGGYQQQLAAEPVWRRRGRNAAVTAG